MTECYASTRRLRRVARTPLHLFLAAVMILVAVWLTGCGDSQSAAPSTTTPPSTEAAASTTTVERVTSLATAISDTWAEAMQRLVALLRDRPEADAIQAQVASLKEECIQKLVALGRDRATMSLDDQQAVSNKAFAAISALGSETWYTDYMTYYDHYSTGELAFANLLASFNILTQYADFELLEEQAPDEAARLGIE